MTSFSSCQSHIFYKYISGEGSRNPSSCPAIAPRSISSLLPGNVKMGQEQALKELLLFSFTMW